MGTVFAIEMPFTDIQTTDPYYGSVTELYEWRVITDNGDHLFRPNDLMNRDFFVSLAVGIGCHKCETPSIGDILKYQISPFVDLPKTNQFYYCIAYAKDNNIAQWYILDNNGKSTCENSKQYMSSPFCATNTITRIEAVAILLRRAKLWDDTLNAGNFDHSSIIPDTTSYWYGYAKKWIEADLIIQKSDKTIGQDEKITRGEFAIMAARILRYTQCQISANTNTVPLDIVILSGTGVPSQKTSFSQWSTETLSIISGTGSWYKSWTLVNTSTNETLTGNTDTYPINKLGCGTWINTVSLIDTSSQVIASTAYNTITIECSNQKTNWLSVDIVAKPISGEITKPISLSSIVGGGSGIISYRWNYDDGSTSQSSGDTIHIFTNSGIYTVTLTVIDAAGNTAQSSLVVKITGDRDTDWDGILDPNDACPLVYAKTLSGCPNIITYPNINTTTSSWITTSNSTISNNICLESHRKTQWIIVGSPNCLQCPCSNSISINSLLRSCDVVFPTILSPTLDAIYSRGWFYLIP